MNFIDVGYSQRKRGCIEDCDIEWVASGVIYITTDGLLDQNGGKGKRWYGAEQVYYLFTKHCR